MNVLTKMWMGFKIPHRDLVLTFKNNELVNYVVNETRVKEYTPEFVQELVQELVKQGMVTFFDDVPNMEVGVPIHTIGITDDDDDDDEIVYIETFHRNLDNLDDDFGFERNVNIPKPLHEFMGLPKPIKDSDY